ncbi:MAG: hypothetical protein ACXVFO_04435 [Solirubrobacteraceae bacterium]
MQLTTPADGEAVDLRGPDPRAHQLGRGRVDEHVAWLGGVGQGERGAGDGRQPPVAIKGKAGVIGAACARVGDVHQPAGRGDADRLVAAGGDRGARDRREPAVRTDPQLRDLVAAGVDGEELTSTRNDLERPLRADH